MEKPLVTRFDELDFSFTRLESSLVEKNYLCIDLIVFCSLFSKKLS